MQVQPGMRFGRWTVLEIGIKNPNSQAKHPPNCALVKCDCGIQRYKEYRDLYSGRSLSCGCQRREQVIRMNKEKGDIPLGTIFGKLTVIEDGGYITMPSGRTIRQHLCRCECGNILMISGNNLKTGTSQSCGCVSSRGERIIAKILRENNIDFKQQVSFSNLKSPKGGSLKFDFGIYVDNELQGLIEFDGRQHYEELNGIWSQASSLEYRQQLDELKNEYCIKNNIPFLRIPYYDIQKINIDYILQGFL